MSWHQLSHSQMTNFRLFQTADDYFKFDENGRKFSKRAENTVGKEEIARYEQFSFAHSFFKKLLLQTRKKPGKGLNVTKYKIWRRLMDLLCLLVLELNVIMTTWIIIIIEVIVTHLCVSWLSHSCIDKTFLSKATEYFFYTYLR